MLSLSTSYVDQFLGWKKFVSPISLEEAHASLQNKTCKGADYLGWIDLPEDMTDEKITEIQNYADTLREKSDVLIACGIGWAYLWWRAIIEAMPTPLNPPLSGGHCNVVFLGIHLSGREYERIFTKYRDKRVSACIISKSGTTMETAISYRLVREFLLSKYSEEEVKKRIVIITDEKNGALRPESDKQWYASFIHPGDVGGRYSVLSEVWLIPCAVAGIDIQKLVQGARTARKDITETPFLKGDEKTELTEGDLWKNKSSASSLGSSFKKELTHPAFVYAQKRVALEQAGFVSELFITSELSLYFLGEWWKQLMGESHGKEGKWLYPDTLSYTTDLHSLGQYVQEGKRLFFETMLWIRDPFVWVKIPEMEWISDGLDPLVGRSLHEMNLIALESTAKAHNDGACPSMIMTLENLTAESMGYFLYTMMYACALSGVMIGVNPFDQPGVEAYKGEMRSRLAK